MATMLQDVLPGVNISEPTRKGHPEVVANRRFLHTIPEIGLQEFKTAEFIESRLDALGLAYERCTPTGILSMIDGRDPGAGPVVMLRADIDALPILEATSHEYVSTRPGFMHACGHDTHTAMQIGVARRLVNEGFDKGRVKLCFQPGEEGHHGAEKMIAAGALENPKVKYCYGQHIWAGSPTGQILIQGGPVMAGVDRLEISLTGKGTHAAQPQSGYDTVYAAAQVITALQTVISRNIDPLEAGVVTVAMINGGTAHNIIPEKVELVGTIRWFDNETHEIIKKRVPEVVTGIANALQVQAEVRIIHEHFPTVNDDMIAEIVRQEAVQIVGEANVITRQRTMGAEDFSDFAREAPGAFAFVGAQNPSKDCVWPHHHPKFNVDEDAFAIGSELMHRVCLRLLELPA